MVRRAGDLTDRTVPALARAYAVAAASLVEADGGLLAPARARLAAAPATPGAAALLDWVAREAAWLDGQPDRAASPAAAPGHRPLVDGLRQITARWAALRRRPPVGRRDRRRACRCRRSAATLTAWAGAGAGFDRAAGGLARPGRAARRSAACSPPGCTRATRPGRCRRCWRPNGLAEEAGLVVLLGRARRALRRHAVRRDTRGPRPATS